MFEFMFSFFLWKQNLALTFLLRHRQTDHADGAVRLSPSVAELPTAASRGSFVLLLFFKRHGAWGLNLF